MLDKLKKQITPESFWDEYDAALHGLSRIEWQDYLDFRKWTQRTMALAEYIMNKTFGLYVEKEYMRIDVMGSQREERYHNWHLRIAYEHENHPSDWQSEFCKLSHIMADLRVLVFYSDFAKRSPAKMIEAHLDKIGDRALRHDPAYQWLFIAGPTINAMDHPFNAYTLRNGVVKEISAVTQPVRPLGETWGRCGASVIAHDEWDSLGYQPWLTMSYHHPVS